MPTATFPIMKIVFKMYLQILVPQWNRYMRANTTTFFFCTTTPPFLRFTDNLHNDVMECAQMMGARRKIRRRRRTRKTPLPRKDMKQLPLLPNEKPIHPLARKLTTANQVGGGVPICVLVIPNQREAIIYGEDLVPHTPTVLHTIKLFHSDTFAKRVLPQCKQQSREHSRVLLTAT